MGILERVAVLFMFVVCLCFTANAVISLFVNVPFGLFFAMTIIMTCLVVVSLGYNYYLAAKKYKEKREKRR
jgi:uncharacterized membrane protein